MDNIVFFLMKETMIQKMKMACNIYLHLFFQDFLFNQAVQNTDYLIKSL